MTAAIAGFVTRADAGLPAPRSVSKNITPSQGGVALHYGGPPGHDGDHAGCVAQWRAWHRFHTVTRGWVDIAYSGGVCQHGYAFAGRGVGVRTAANGTNAGNDDFYAICWLGGEGQVPTQAALDAFEWWVAQLRAQGAGNRVVGHRDLKSTGCPGEHILAHARRLDRAPIGSVAPVPARPVPKPATSPVRAPAWPLSRCARHGIGEYFGPRSGPDHSVSGYFSHRADLQRWQQRMIDRGWGRLLGRADGLYGDNTARVAELFQREKGLAVDRLIGPSTWAAAWTATVTP